MNDYFKDKLELTPDHWYAWQMFPGYSGDLCVPYCSPIHIDSVTPKKTGKRILEIEFFNAFYAQGAQGFVLDVRVLKHYKNYMIVELIYQNSESNRTAIISQIEFQWLERFFPELWKEKHPDRTSANGNINCYLDILFRQATPSRENKLTQECIDAIPRPKSQWSTILEYLDTYSQVINGYEQGNNRNSGGYEQFLMKAEKAYDAENTLPDDNDDLLAMIYLIYRRNHTSQPYTDINEYRRIVDAILQKLHDKYS